MHRMAPPQRTIRSQMSAVLALRIPELREPLHGTSELNSEHTIHSDVCRASLKEAYLTLVLLGITVLQGRKQEAGADIPGQDGGGSAGLGGFPGDPSSKEPTCQCRKHDET